MRLITEKEAAKLLKIPERTLINLRKQGEISKIPYITLGGRIRYHAEDLINWVRTQRIPSNRGRHKAIDVDSEFVRVG